MKTAIARAIAEAKGEPVFVLCCTHHRPAVPTIAPLYYTGKAGDDWTDCLLESAWPYQTKDGAYRQKAILNSRTPLHGLSFEVLTIGPDDLACPACKSEDVQRHHFAPTDGPEVETQWKQCGDCGHQWGHE